MINIDFHSHVLPLVDHGSDSLQVSLKQIEYARSANIDVILATPHFYPHKHSVDKFISTRNNAYEELIKNTDMPILRAAEVLLCDSLHKIEGLELLCIEGTDTLLIELPFADFREQYVSAVENMIYDGYDVILAHADRYPKENIERLVELGAKIQLNASSLTKFLTKKHIYDWIDRDLVVGLGSDIHMLNENAYKLFVKAKKRLGANFEKIMLRSANILGVSNH